MQIQEAIRVLVLTLFSFVVALLATPFLVKLLDRYAIKKQIRSAEVAPVFNKFHDKKNGTPTMGGVVIWATTLLLAGFLWVMQYFFGGLWVGASFIDRAETYLPIASLFLAGLIGLFDDLLGVLRIGPKGGGLSIVQKIFLFFGIALIGAWWFYFKLDFNAISLPLMGFFTHGQNLVQIGVWYVPIFIFIIVASAFSANETDGLDGLLGGVSLFAFGSLMVIAFALGRYDLATFSGVVMGALLAFLWFNIYPARFFMGDTGSMSLGITLGIMALLTNTVILLPFFVPIFVIESLSVIIQLISKKLFKRKIFLSTPIHHHFEALGWHESQVTMRFWIISVVSCGLGLAIFFLSRVL